MDLHFCQRHDPGRSGESQNHENEKTLWLCKADGNSCAVTGPHPGTVSVARQCGGCQIQQMSYERQLTFKENKVCNNLRRLGGLDLSAMEVEPICGMEEPFHYRNKAQFPIGRDKNGKIIAGFYAGRTHSIIATPTVCSEQKKMKQS